jgi:hypothetical protein
LASRTSVSAERAPREASRASVIARIAVVSVVRAVAFSRSAPVLSSSVALSLASAFSLSAIAASCAFIRAMASWNPADDEP